MRSIRVTALKDMSFSGRLVSRVASAREVALVSTMRAKHGAILLQGSRVLAVGVNSNRNDPAFLEQGPKPTGISTHAEVAATRIHADVPNTTLIVVRVMRSTGQLGDSKPCPECLHHLVFNTRVREVIYSESE